jgi:hypothetical protein
MVVTARAKHACARCNVSKPGSVRTERAARAWECVIGKGPWPAALASMKVASTVLTLVLRYKK